MSILSSLSWIHGTIWSWCWKWHGSETYSSWSLFSPVALNCQPLHTCQPPHLQAWPWWHGSGGTRFALPFTGSTLSHAFWSTWSTMLWQSPSATHPACWSDMRSHQHTAPSSVLCSPVPCPWFLCVQFWCWQVFMKPESKIEVSNDHDSTSQPWTLVHEGLLPWFLIELKVLGIREPILVPLAVPILSKFLLYDN